MNELFSYQYDDGGRSDYFPKKAGDCVCRAIAITTGIDYMDIFELLKETMKCNPNRGILCHKPEFRRMMNKLGFRYGVVSGMAAHLRKGEIPSKGRLVCLTKRHAIAVIDGVVHDIYDSRFVYRGIEKKEQTIYGYYKYQDMLNEG